MSVSAFSAQVITYAKGKPIATNQTNVHKKMDKILHKLETLEDNDKAIAKHDSQRQHQESQAMARDMAQILLEVKKSSDETAKRVAELLGQTHKHERAELKK